MNAKKADAIRAQKFPFRIGDVAVLAVAVALTVALLCTLPSSEAGKGVEIAYAGAREVLPLDRNTERRLADHLTLVIEGGKAWVKDADCRNRICVKTGKISRVGESIVCAENKIVITVTGRSPLAGTVGQS